MDLSVVICSQNPRPHYFARVLEALRNQSLDQDRWELLVIDNGSKEPLKAAWDLSWHPHARHVSEDEPGVVAARRRGMVESVTDLLVYVDDDNVLASNYLSCACKIKNEWPLLGTWGSGCIVPEFEIEPPEHLTEFLHVLTLREVKSPRWSNTFAGAGLHPEVAPWGAGQCIRTEVMKEYCRFSEQSKIRIPARIVDMQENRVARFILNGTARRWWGRDSGLESQARVSSGGAEDIEMSFVACDLGWGMGIFPELRVTHLIPKERISDDYFLKIGEITGTSNLILEYKWHGIEPRDPFSLRGIIGALKQAATTRGFRRQMYFAGLRAAIRAQSIIAASD